jgi:uncharacterized membrane protein
VSNTTIDIDPNDYTIDRSGPARPASPPGRDKAKLTQAFVTTAATVGVITAGVALIEAALIPGLLIGGAAVLAPKYLSGYLPGLRRRRQPPLKSASRRQTTSPERLGVNAPPAILAKSLVKSLAQPSIKQAIAKTITFRIIVTTLDFSVNYLVIGELATAAGLSAVSLVVGDLATAAALSASGFILGPFVYLGHEMAWDYYRSNNEPVPELPALGNLLPAPG